MKAAPFPPNVPRLWSACTLVLLCTYFIGGVFGRFPWKADEPYSFGIIWEMLEDHAWIIPRVADQPFVEKPPLVYWLGAAFARMFPALPAHESSRLAIVLLVSISVIALYLSAKWLFPEADAWLRARRSDLRSEGPAPSAAAVSPSTYALLAILLMAGTPGFAEHIHKLTADLGQLSGALVGICGFVRIGTRWPAKSAATESHAHLLGGILLGTGAGMALMSKGLLVPGILFVTLLGCLFIPAYRRHIGVSLPAAALSSAPWFVVWPFLLHRASPELFNEWLWDNNFGRFFGFVALGGNRVSLASWILSTLVMSFPPLLLFGWVLLRTWRLHASSATACRWTILENAPAHACVALYAGASLLVLAASASIRDIYVLPVLPAMVLLGLPALALQPNRSPVVAKRAMNVGFALAATLVIVVWASLAAHGDLALLPWLAGLAGKWLPLPFEMAIRWPAIIVTVLTLLVWGFVARHGPLDSPAIAWCSGVAMLWVVSSELWLPWIDAARSYKAVFSQVAHLVKSESCVATLNLGESELSMLDYVTRPVIRRMYLGHSGTGDRSRPNPSADKCDRLLLLANRASRDMRPDPRIWSSVWTGSRPADRNERFILYRKL